jgi:succinyl-CoA synthetase beta subunit
MKIHEYQGKEILRRFGVRTPRGMMPTALAEQLAEPVATALTRFGELVDELGTLF